MSETIAIGSDHAGFKLKRVLIAELRTLGFEVQDFGTYSEDSADYPQFAYPVAQAVSNGTYKRGILICGSGQGVNMTANKLPNIRSALCQTVRDAESSRAHNDANILALGQNISTEEDSKAMLRVFLKTEFDGNKAGGERHARRVQQMIDGYGCR